MAAATGRARPGLVRRALCRRGRSFLASAALVALAARALGGGLEVFSHPSGGHAQQSGGPQRGAPAAIRAGRQGRAGGPPPGLSVVGSVAGTATAAACAFCLGLLVAAQSSEAMLLKPTNIRSFDEFVNGLEKQFIPLQKALFTAESEVEETKDNVKAIEKAEFVLEKMEAKEKAVIKSTAPVEDPFAKDDLKTLKQEEKAIAVLEETVEEMKKQPSTSPEEKKLLDAVEAEAEKDRALIIQDEAKAENKEVPKTKDILKEPPQDASPPPAAEVLKEEKKVMQVLEDMKAEALKAEQKAEDRLAKVKADIASETKKEAANLKEVKADLMKEAEKEAAEQKKDVKEVAKELEQKAEQQLNIVKEDIKAEIDTGAGDADKKVAVLKVEKLAEKELADIKVALDK